MTNGVDDVTQVLDGRLGVVHVVSLSTGKDSGATKAAWQARAAAAGLTLQAWIERALSLAK